MKRREQGLFFALLLAAALGLALMAALAPRGGRGAASLDPGLPPETAPAPAPGHATAPEPELAPRELAPPREEAAGAAGARAAVPRAEGPGRVEGRVVLEDGLTPAPGIRALLGEGPLEPDASFAAEQLLRPAPLRLASTDADGRFRFAGLDPAQTYSLVLGGGGRVGAQRRWPVRPDREPATYSLHRLFGALVHLREPGGGPVRLNPGLQGQRLGQSTFQTPGVFPLYGAPASAVLAGLDPALLGEQQVGDRLMLYTSANELEQLGPIRFRADYPGYERVELELVARFVAQGLEERVVELVPTARGFGTLVIDVHGWTGDCAAFENPRGAAALLRLQSARGELLTFELPEVEGPRIEVAGLPYGTWKAVVMLGTRVASPARRADEAQTVEIGPAPARYDLDLSSSASIVLEVLKADGTPHTGHVSFLYGLESGQDRAWRTQHFLEPPYRIDELAPGTYRLVMQIPFGAGTEARTPRLVSARGGECTRVELREE